MQEGLEMKVKYEKIHNIIGKDCFCEEFEYTYRTIEISFCCEEMKDAFKEWCVVFGNDFTCYGKEYYKHNTNNKINIYKVVSSDYDSNDYDHLVREISFCPFCGERIVYDV